MRYTNEEKLAIIQRRSGDDSITALCEAYGISRSTFYRWEKDLIIKDAAGSRAISLNDYYLLLRRAEKQENIIRILKSVHCTVDAPLKERLLALEALYGQYNVATLCEALDVARGTFYNHILRNKRGNAWFEKRREEFRVIIQDVFNEYRQVLGPAKIQAVLEQRGYQVSTKFIAKMMQEMGLSSLRTPAKQDYLKTLAPEKKSNILHQQFIAEQPNQIWVSDVTCFKLGDRYFYICVVIDLFSRKVIAYKTSQKNSTQLLTATFNAAYQQRKPEAGLIFHSDRGSQYTSNRFQQLLRERAVIQSFSNSGKPHDNAVSESFFASMKREELYRRDYHSELAFKQGVASYIEFYNGQRPHKTLKQLTPDKAEELFAAGFGAKDEMEQKCSETENSVIHD